MLVIIMALGVGFVFGDGLLIGTNSKQVADQILGKLITNPEQLLLYMGDNAAKAGNNDIAARVYQTIMARNPSFGAAFNNLGVLMAKKGEMQKAQLLFKEATDKDGSARQWYNLALSYYYQDDFNNALISLHKVVSLEPNNDHAWFDLGIVAGELFDNSRDTAYLEVASEAFNKVYALNPDFPYAKQNVDMLAVVLQSS